MRSHPLSRLQTANQLLDALNSLQRAWEAAWRQICEEADLHPSQAQALLYLAGRGAIPMQELSRGLCVAPSTATRLVEQMEKVNWVVRSGDPEDRRRVLIQLLARGEDRAWELQSLAQTLLWQRSGTLLEARPVIEEMERIAGHLRRPR